ncbi:NAD-binding protein [Candidatus Pacearchaeota archaeon]|nr:NAD-binding protein [Candidatus Pacearchaeota archaeon]
MKEPYEILEEIPKKIKVFFALILIILLVGIIGFSVIQHSSFSQSFVYTLESLSFMFTIESGPGKYLEIFLAIFGVMTMGWIITNIFEMFIGGNFSEYLKMQNIFNKLRKMNNHYIIAGGGRVGEELAVNLSRKKEDYIIIEKDESKILKLKKAKVPFIIGDVTDEEILNKAGIKKAKAIIIAMPETEKNLLVTMMAKDINSKIEVYARADKPAFVSKLKKAGAKIVVVPELAAAEKLLESID